MKRRRSSQTRTVFMWLWAGTLTSQRMIPVWAVYHTTEGRDPVRIKSSFIICIFCIEKPACHTSIFPVRRVKFPIFPRRGPPCPARQRPAMLLHTQHISQRVMENQMNYQMSDNSRQNRHLFLWNMEMLNWQNSIWMKENCDIGNCQHSNQTKQSYNPTQKLIFACTFKMAKIIWTLLNLKLRKRRAGLPNHSSLLPHCRCSA